MSPEFYRPTISVSKPATDGILAGITAAKADESVGESNWKLTLNASGQYSDQGGTLRTSSLVPYEVGVHPAGTSGFDVLIDFLAPPAHPDANHPYGYLANLNHSVDFQRLATDMRGAPGTGETTLSWTVVIDNSATVIDGATRVPSDWTLSWSASGLPLPWYALTIAPAGGSPVDMLTTSSLTVPGDATTTYTVTATRDIEPPAITALDDLGAFNEEFVPDVAATDNATEIADLIYEWSGDLGVSFSEAGVSSPVISADEEGTYSVTLTVTDAAGNSDSKTMTFAWDTTPPTLALDPLDAGYQRAPFSVATIKSDGSGLPVTVTWEKLTGTGDVTVEEVSETAVSVSASADGDYSVTATATDAAGNTSGGALLFTWDATAPTVSVEPTDGGYRGEGFEATATASDGANPSPTLEWTYVGGSGPFATGSSATIAFDWRTGGQDDGEATARVTATDAAGNTAFVDIPFVWDATAPTASAGTDAGAVNAEFAQAGSASDETSGVASVAWSQVSGAGDVAFGTPDDAETTVSADSDGEYVIRITVTDNAGNTASDDAAFTWDTTNPFADAGSDAGAKTETFTQVGSATDAGSGVDTISWTTVSGPGTVAFGSPDAATTTVTADTDGEYVIRITVTDNAGNASTNDAAFTWDATDPTADAGADAGAVSETFEQSGSASDETSGVASVVWSKVSGAGVVAFSPPFAGTTNVTADGDGEYVIRLTVTDNAGNTASDDAAFTWDTADPTADAGADAGAVSEAFTQAGSASDETSGVASVAWSKVSGPGVVEFGTSDVEETTVSADADGEYVIRLTVTDAAGNTASDDTTFSWDATAPTVDAGGHPGTRKTTFTLAGSASDDGSGIASVAWSQVSGPGVVAFGTPDAEETTVSADSDGEYVVRLTATDAAGNTATSDSTFRWKTKPPKVAAGTSAGAVNGTFTQSGSVTDTIPGYSVAWSAVSGAGDVVFGASDEETTTVTADTDGEYVIRLTATDEVDNSASDDVSFIWDETAPTVSAGDSPGGVEGTFTQSGSASDETSGVASVAWSQVSGPGVVEFGTPDAAATTVTADTEGEYVVRITATDNAGNTATDDAAFTWAPAPPVVSAGTPPSPQRATFTQEGSATDEGSGIASVAWSQVSGGGTIAFGTPDEVVTTVTASADGFYIIRLTATDADGNSASDDVDFTWDTGKPTVNAGVSGELYRATFSQVGSADDSLSGVASVEWEKVSGPGLVTFGAPSSAFTSVSADMDGEYEISLTATDDAGNTASAIASFLWDATAPTVTIEAVDGDQSESFAPVVSATDNRTPDAELSFLWTVPAGVSLSSRTAKQPTITGTANGTYTLTLTVTDEAGNAAEETLAFVWLSDKPQIIADTFQGVHDEPFAPTLTVVAPGGLTLLWTGPDGVSFSDAAAMLPTISALEDGVYTVSFSATDAFDQTTTVALEFIWKTSGPVISGDTDQGHHKAAFAPSVEITDSISSVDELAIAWTGSAGVVFSDPASPTPTVGATSDGAAAMTVSVTDIGGTKTTKTFDFVWDTHAPIVVAPEDLGDFREPFAPAVTATDALTVVGDLKFAWGGASGVAISDPASATPAVSASADGVYALEVTVTDRAGNSASAATFFAWDTTPPVIALGSETIPHNKDFAPTVSVTDNIAEASELAFSWSGPSAVLFSDASAMRPTIGAGLDGEYIAEIEATDPAGNTATARLPFVWDATAPDIVFAAEPDLPAYLVAFLLTATVEDASELDAGSIRWTQSAGPGVVLVADPASLATPVSASEVGAYTVDLTATDAAGNTGTASFSFNWTEPLVVTGAEPQFVKAATGGEVTIAGSGFGEPTRVLVSGTPTSVIVGPGGASLRVAVAEGEPGSKTVEVISRAATPFEQKTTAIGLITYLPPPAISAVEPASGPVAGGLPARILGTGFRPDARVFWDGKPTSAVYVTETELSLTIPPALSGGPIDIRVVNDDGQPYSLDTTVARGFTYLLTGAVTSVEPPFATLEGGQILTIIGSGFPESLNVFVGGIASSVRRLSDTQLSVTAPPRETPGLVGIRIESPLLFAPVDAPNAVDYLPRLDILGVEPNLSSVTGGIAAVVSGFGFRSPAEVFFGEASAAVTSIASASAAVTVPPGAAGRVPVRVVTDRGQSYERSATLSDGFRYVADPAITGVEPSRGPLGGGTNVTIRGADFSPDAQILFGSVAATVVSRAPALVVATPRAERSGPVDVTVVSFPSSPSERRATLPGGFTYLSGLFVSGVNPKVGRTGGGTSVTITGTGFVAAGSPIVFFGAGRATPSSVTETTIVVATPASDESATVDVTVVQFEGTGAEERFTLANAFRFDDAPEVSNVAITSAGEDGRIDSTTPLTVTFTVSDDFDDPSTLPVTIKWLKNGAVIPGRTNAVLPTEAFRRGDNISVEVFVRGTSGRQSNVGAAGPVKIGNALPTAVAAMLLPPGVESAGAGSATPIVVRVTTPSRDPDNDPVSLKYVWRRNGTVAPEVVGAVLSPEISNKGESWTVAIIPNDGTDNGPETTLGPVRFLNAKPVLGLLRAQRVVEGDELFFTATATDADPEDAANLSFGIKVVESPVKADVTIDAKTGRARVFVAAVPRTTQIVLEVGVSDSVDTMTQNVLVNVLRRNRPPILTTDVSTVDVQEGVPINIAVSATDPDGEAVRFSVFSADATPEEFPGIARGDAAFNTATPVVVGEGPTATHSGVWNATPLVSRPGRIVKLSFVARDSNAGSQSSASVQLRFNVTNLPPTLARAIPDQVVNENEPFVLSLAEFVTDPEGDPLFFTGRILPRGSSLDERTGALAWTPTFDQSRTYTVNVDARDREDPNDEAVGKLELVFQINVINANRPPEITGPATIVVNEGETRQALFRVTDPDNEAVTVIETFSPARPAYAVVTTDVAAGAVIKRVVIAPPSGTPSDTFTISVNAADAARETASSTAIVEVRSVNRPPIARALPPMFVAEGGRLAFSFSVSDPNARDALTVTLENPPASAAFTFDASNPNRPTVLWMVERNARELFGESLTLNFSLSDGTVSVPYAVLVNITEEVTAARPAVTGLATYGSSGDITLGYLIEFRDATTLLSVTPSFRVSGESAWRPMTVLGGIAGLTAGPHKLLWQSATDFPARGSVEVRLVPSDGRDGIAGTVALEVDNEPLTPPSFKTPVVAGSEVSVSGSVPYRSGVVEFWVVGVTIPIAIAPVQPDGTFFASRIVPDGTYQLTALYRRDARASRSTAPVTVIVDTSAPRFVMIQPAAGRDGSRATTSRTPTVVFAVDGGRSGVNPDSIAATMNGVPAVVAFNPATSIVSVVSTQTYRAGTVVVVVIRARNRAEREGTGGGAFLVEGAVDRTGPSILSISPARGGVAYPSTPIVVAVSDSSGIDSASVALTLDGNPLTARFVPRTTEDGSVQAFASALAPREHIIRLTVADKAGNATSVSSPFRVTAPFGPPRRSPMAVTKAATNEPTYNLSGTTEPDRLVSLIVNDVSQSTSLSGSDGSWKAVAALAPGMNRIQAFATDTLGTQQAVSDPYEVLYDTIAPAIAVLTPTLGATSNTARPTFRGTVSDDAAGVDASSVRLLLNGSPVAATFDAATGIFAFEPAEPLTTATVDVVVEATDMAGNAATRSGVVAIDDKVVDTVAPMLSNPTVAGRLFVPGATLAVGTAQPEIAVVVTDDSGVASVTGTLDNAPTTLALSGSVARLTPPELAPGSHKLVLEAADTLGNASATFAIEFVVDTVAPAPVFGTVPSPTNADHVELVLTGSEPGATAQIAVNGVPVSARADSREFRASSVALTEGNNEFTATVTDLAGNVGVAPALIVVRDSRAPTVAITSPVDGSVVSAKPVPFTAIVEDDGGIAKDSVVVRLDGQMVPASALRFEGSDLSGALDIPPSDAPSRVLTVSAKDITGNETTTSSVFSVDAIPPAISGSDPKGVVGTLEPVVSAVVSSDDVDPATLRVRFRRGAEFEDVTASATFAVDSGQVLYIPGVLEDGKTYEVAVEISDRAGNVAKTQWQFDVKVGAADDTPPTMIANFPPPGGTINSTNLSSMSFNMSDSNTGVDANNVFLYINDPENKNPVALADLLNGGVASYNRQSGEVNVNLRLLNRLFAPRGGGFSFDPLELNALERSLGGGGASFDPLELNALERSLGGGGASFDPLELNALERSLGGGGASFDPLELNALERSLGGGGTSFDPLELNALERSVGGGGVGSFDPQSLGAFEQSLSGGGILGVGENSLAVQAQDNNGNISFIQWSFRIVTEPPAKPAFDATAPYTNVAAMRLTGSVGGIYSATPIKVDVSVNGVAAGVAVINADAVNNATGAFAIPSVALREGENTIVARATDAAGNLSERSDTLRLTLDSVAPAVQLNLFSATSLGGAAIPSATRSSAIRLIGTVADNSGAAPAKTELILNGARVAATPQNRVEFDATLNEGVNVLQFVAVDQAGNVGSTAEKTIVLDTVPPTAIPANVVVLPSGSGQVFVRWAADPNGEIAASRIYRSANGAPILNASGMTPSATISTSLGTQLPDRVTEGITYSYGLTALDAAGNEAADRVSYPYTMSLLTTEGGNVRLQRPDGSVAVLNAPAGALFASRSVRATLRLDLADLAALPALSVAATPVPFGAFVVEGRLASGDFVGSINPNGAYLSPAVLSVPLPKAFLDGTHEVVVYRVTRNEPTWQRVADAQINAETGILSVAVTGSGTYQIVDLSRDSDAPQITQLAPASGATLQTLVPTLTASVRDDSEIADIAFALIVDGVEKPIAGTVVRTPSTTDSRTTLVSLQVPEGLLRDGGSYEIALVAKDFFGNVGRQTTSVTVRLEDTVPPVVLSAKPGYPNAEADPVTTLLPTVEVTLADEKSDVGNVSFVIDGIPFPTAAVRSSVVVDGKAATRASVAFPLEFWTAETALANDGRHTFEARFADALGNAASVSWTVLVRLSDATPPVVTRVDVTGNDTETPTLELVITEPSAPVLLARATADGIAVAVGSLNAKATANGLSVTIPEGAFVGEGEHEFAFVLADAIGNVGSGSTPVTITLVDRKAPEIVGFLPDGVVDTLTPDLLVAFTEDRSQPVALEALKLNGAPVDLNLLKPTIEADLMTLPIPEGIISKAGAVDVELTLRDAVGNAATQNWTFTIALGDSDAPRVLGVSLDGTPATTLEGVARTLTPTLEWRIAEATGLGQLQLTVNGKPLTPEQLAGLVLTTPDAGNARALLTLPDGILTAEGAYQLKGVFTDTAGNQSAWDFTLNVRFPDVNAPRIATVSPTGYINTTTPTFRIEANEASGIGAVAVLMDGKPVTVSATIGAVADPKTMPWPISFQIPSGALTPLGKHLVEITVTDLDGNRGTAQWEFIVDAVAPKVLVQLPADASRLVVGKPQLDVMFSEDTGLQKAEFYLNNALIGSVDGAKTQGGIASYQVPSALSDGDYVVTARLIDLAGNVTESRWGFSVTVDNVAPTLLRTFPLANVAVADARPEIRVEYSDAASEVNALSVRLFVDNERVRPSLRDGKTVVFQPESDLALGEHRVRVELADVAGNVTTNEWTFLHEAAPWVAEMYPSNGSQLRLQPRIGLRFADDLSGVDPANVKLSVTRNARPVEGSLTVAAGVANARALSAPMAQWLSMVTPTEVWFEPSETAGLRPGVYVVEARINDKAGLETVSRWTFAVQEASLMSAPRILSEQTTGDTPHVEFYVAQSADVAINIYTTTGLLLATERQEVPAAAGMTRVSVPISGRNTLGERLAAGVHICVVEVKAGDRVERRTVKALIR